VQRDSSMDASLLVRLVLRLPVAVLATLQMLDGLRKQRVSKPKAAHGENMPPVALFHLLPACAMLPIHLFFTV
jgi:hypothetical protein